MSSSKITAPELLTDEEIKEILVGRGYEAKYVEQCLNGTAMVRFQTYMTALKQTKREHMQELAK